MTETARRMAFAEACLALAADKGWRGVTLFDVAAAAGFPVAELHPLAPADAFECVDDLLDRAAAQGAVAPDLSLSARERVFDAAMRRFEAMEARRAGVLALERALEADPVAQAASLARAGRSARWLLALAGEDMNPARASALALALRQAKAAWKRDEAGDFARTMATLDRNLRRAESLFEQIGKVAGVFKPAGRTEPPPPADADSPEDRPAG